MRPILSSHDQFVCGKSAISKWFAVRSSEGFTTSAWFSQRPNMSREAEQSQYYSYHNAKTANFDQAVAECANLGRDLAMVKNVDEWRELSSYEETGEEYVYWWLGAERKETAEEYRWVDGEAFHNFSPNVSISGDSPGNRCLALYSHASLNTVKLYSMPCNQHMYFICGRQRWPEEQTGNSTNMTSSKGPPTTAMTSRAFELEPFDDTTLSSEVFEMMESAKPPKQLFPLVTDTDSDPGLWMFVALTLALLLVIALIVIIVLWMDRINVRRRGRSPVKNNNNADPESGVPSAENEGKTPDATSPMVMSSMKVEE